MKNELKEVKKSNEDLKKANVTKAKECDKLLVKMKEVEAIVVGKGQAPGPVNTAALESRLLSLEQLTQKQAARLMELQATNQPSAAAEVTAPLSKSDTILEPRLAALELQVVSLEKRAKEESKDQKSAGSSVDEDMARHREHIQAQSRLLLLCVLHVLSALDAGGSDGKDLNKRLTLSLSLSPGTFESSRGNGPAPLHDSRFSPGAREPDPRARVKGRRIRKGNCRSQALYVGRHVKRPGFLPHWRHARRDNDRDCD